MLAQQFQEIIIPQRFVPICGIKGASQVGYVLVHKKRKRVDEPGPQMYNRNHTDPFSYSAGEDRYRDTTVWQRPSGSRAPSQLCPWGRGSGFGGVHPSQPQLPFLNKINQKVNLSLNEIKQLSLLLFSSSTDLAEFLGCQIFTICESDSKW